MIVRSLEEDFSFGGDLLLRAAADWVILVELVDSIDTKERHVLTDGKSEVISVILLLEYDFVTKFLAEEGHISRS